MVSAFPLLPITLSLQILHFTDLVRVSDIFTAHFIICTYMLIPTCTLVYYCEDGTYFLLSDLFLQNAVIKQQLMNIFAIFITSFENIKIVLEDNLIININNSR